MTEAATSQHGSHTQPFTEQLAHDALTRACHAAGLSSITGELIRMGSNAVFRVEPDIIVRVAPSATLADNAKKQIAVARWLASVGYPAARALDIQQPISVGNQVVTFWVSVSRETVYAPIADVARLIRMLHDMDAPPGLALPRIHPFGAKSETLPAFPGLPGDDARFLVGRIKWAREMFDRLPFDLPSGVIHGDANVGNVLVDDTGHPVLIDLDSFAIGPREWDLIQTALFADRLGWHTENEYRVFVDAYGYDIREWSGYETLADMREIAMTSWLSKKASTSESAAVEAVKRINAIRTGGTRRDWGAY